eukprot:1841225-Pleurochrysis_carterae.AAC.2
MTYPQLTTPSRGSRAGTAAMCTNGTMRHRVASRKLPPDQLTKYQYYRSHIDEPSCKIRCSRC